MTETSLTAAGLELASAWRARRRIEALDTDPPPITVADGYRAQDALVTAMARPVVGFKIGATNKSLQRYFEVDEPFFGRLFADFVKPSPLSLGAGDVFNHAIEAEYVFRIGGALPVSSAPFNRDQVAAAVAGVHPAIEIPDSRFTNWRSVGIAHLIADNAIAGYLTYGEGTTAWRVETLPSQPVEITVNGTRVARGSGANVLGNPVDVLVWLANTLAARGMALEPGQLVTTGSTTDLVIAEPGDEVVADFGTFGTVQVTFAESLGEE